MKQIEEKTEATMGQFTKGLNIQECFNVNGLASSRLTTLGGNVMYYPEPISKLIDSFMKLPGIGPKTAVRLAFFVLDMEDDDVVDFAKALVRAKRELNYCEICGHIPIKKFATFVKIRIVTKRSFVL